MLSYDIKGETLPAVVCYPQKGQTIVCQKGAMSWMSPNMQMKTAVGTGGFSGLFGRMMTNESAFLNKYIATGDGALIAFASQFPGSIIPFDISPGNELIVQKGGFLCAEEGVNLSMYFQKKLGGAFFGGEGFVMQKLSGNGTAFVEIDGSCVAYELEPGQEMIVDTGYLAAMSSTCTFDITTVKGLKNIALGGEGLFNIKVKGPGSIYIQTMPINKTAETLSMYMPYSNK